GNPAPALPQIRPTAVVERRIAPRRVVDPRPAPRCYPDPPSIAIAPPIVRNVLSARLPDVAVFDVIAPRAVRIEILIADRSRRHVVRRDRVLGAGFALVCPQFQGPATTG